jgi:hypothetical protein
MPSVISRDDIESVIWQTFGRVSYQQVDRVMRAVDAYTRVQVPDAVFSPPVELELGETDEEETVRCCRMCGETKPLIAFRADRRGDGGRRKTCLKCRPYQQRKTA